MPKLTYIKSQCRVRLEFSKRECLQSEAPPNDLWQRARTKLDQEIAGGELAFYFFYDDKVREVWQALREGFEDDATVIAVTMAAGAPPIKGIKVTKSWNPWVLANLTLQIDPDWLKGSRFYFLGLTIRKLLENQGITKEPCPASIHDAYLKACEGELIKDFPLRESMSKGNIGGAPFKFIHDRSTKEIRLVIDDINQITPPVWQQLNEQFKTEVQTASNRNGRHYKVLVKYIRQRLLSAGRGIERFGFDMPLELLAAYYSDPKNHSVDKTTFDMAKVPYAIPPAGSAKITVETNVGSEEEQSTPSKSGFFATIFDRVFHQEEDLEEEAPNAQTNLTQQANLGATGKQPAKEANPAKNKAPSNSKQPEIEDTPQAPSKLPPGATPLTFRIDISPDKMTATIAGFPDEAYGDQPIFDEATIEQLITKAGIQFGIVDNFKRDLKDKFEAKAPLNGMIVAKGTLPKPGANPFIKHSYQTAQKNRKDLDAVQIDVRSRGHSELVKGGGLIAEIGFNDPPVSGQNVLGETSAPKIPEDINRFKAGENVKLEGLRFLATTDGTPKITGEIVSLEPVYSLDGDVNLASGDLEYKGDVNINGSIDVGATVTVFGNLKVSGEILEAKVFVSGNLIVEGGIITGSKGKVYCRGDVTAKFVDNSQVVAKGNLTLDGNLVGSRVFVLGDVKTGGESGLIFGGEVSALGTVTCQNLGRAGNDSTIVRAGHDWYWSNAVKRRSHRIKVWRKVEKEIKDEYNRMASTPVNLKIEDKIKQGLATAEKRLKRFTMILAKAEEHLEKAKGEVGHDQARTILVHKKLSATALLTLADNDIKVPADFEGVLVTYKPKRGSHFGVPEAPDSTKKAS